MIVLINHLPMPMHAQGKRIRIELSPFSLEKKLGSNPVNLHWTKKERIDIVLHNIRTITTKEST
jgi:hypothetical protein